ncbi:hypothetical protein KP509_19G024900 [Ceratopteris richardii]|uniref:Glyoxysomal processing protease, glyoxysomal n=1 Tax=Ceratopteris richardii TaxID=49495 RepID=A0A8T2SJJ2_CERRI|nr:hypothetical protein KP509_19G024900 [Ceratopteris richardii]
MVPREVTVAARAAAVMVRVHGPDPKGRKMRNHAFHHSESGDTTLSASGWLLHKDYKAHESENMSIVVTCASIIEPFLRRLSSLDSSSQFQVTKDLMLIPGAEIDVLMEDFEQCHGQAEDGHHNMRHFSSWLSAKLTGLVDVPLAGTALQTLLDAHGGSSDGAWEIGWALAHADPSRSQRTNTFPHKGRDQIPISKRMEAFDATDEEKSADNIAFMMTRVAVLTIDTSKRRITSTLALSESFKKGDFLLVVGSPFGALSPIHFFNSMVVGITSNCWPPAASSTSLLMADLRCLPGMEGAPVFNENGAFVGILSSPLRQKGGGAEVQLVITWEALAPPLKEFGIELIMNCPKVASNAANPLNYQEPRDFSNGSLAFSSSRHDGIPKVRHHAHLSADLSKAVASVVLVTVGDGAWASGMLINNKGLILTNAHLLEPWRFGKAQFSKPQNEISVSTNALETHDLKNLRWPSITATENPHFSNGLRRQTEKIQLEWDQDSEMYIIQQEDASVTHECKDSLNIQPAFEMQYRSYRKIRVRLEHPSPRTWYDARAIYISRGPLDIALLQLDKVPADLVPIKPEEDCPFPGTRAIVIGHGLFGPRSELCPSLSAGVVSRVVKTGGMPMSPSEGVPAMLETTAAVHPGGSGGAVVNEHGRLIGLVTSNARHSGGAVIPHLNFSIPYAFLKPIFSFASGEIKDLSSLSTLCVPDEQLSAVWALVPPTPPRPTQVLPFLPDVPKRVGSISQSMKTEQKGSRFAKFLAESKLQLPKQSQLIKEASSEIFKTSDCKLSSASLPGQVFHSRL